MSRALKWIVVTLMCAVVVALAVFINPRISFYLSQRITIGILWVFSLFFLGHSSLISYFLDLILKIIFNMVFLAGEIALALAGMTWMGMRGALQNKP